MVPLVAGFVLLWIGSTLLRQFLRASPALLAARMKQGAGVVLLGFALLMLVRGRIDLALGFGGLGFWLASGRTAGIWSTLRRARPTGTRRARMSRVRSATIEMELDHTTGVMTGTVLAGPFEGASLVQLDRERLVTLYDFCRSVDVEGARLLEAYFDRRFPGWRAAEQNQGHPGSRRGSAAGAGGRASSRSGAMSEEEAYQLLGLAQGASREEVARAHRTVMKKAHPDHGGSTDLAARVNEAKDVLMRRHP